jgi:L-ascorbate metabolism protein UlaG (beta-lactamase superfamily)
MERTVVNNSSFKNTMVKEQFIFPVLGNTTGKVLIQAISGAPDFLYNSYLITSYGGESVVVDPACMPSKEIFNMNPAAIISTHNHFDHVDEEFTNSYENSKKILYTVDDIKTKDFHIYTILSSHKGDTIEEGMDNYMSVFEVDGLRIAHLGDLGQNKLTEEQLKSLGKIDIAIMQYENYYSDMYLDNEKAFYLISQVKPKIIIPTHYSLEALPMFEKKYGTIVEVDNLLAISKADLPHTDFNLFRILNTHKYK